MSHFKKQSLVRGESNNVYSRLILNVGRPLHLITPAFIDKQMDDERVFLNGEDAGALQPNFIINKIKTRDYDSHW
jgi:hypothetical protein